MKLLITYCLVYFNMKLKQRTYRTILFLSLLSMIANAQEKDVKYLNLTPPSSQPEVFAPGIISIDEEYEFGSVFNKAGTEFYYAVNVNGKEEIKYSKLVVDSWSEPVTLLAHPLYGYNDPFLSPDEQRLYFISQRALNGKDKKEDYDIWYVEKTNDGWSEPINAGTKINTQKDEYYISFTNDGTMYFSSERDGKSFNIYYSKFLNGQFQEPIPLDDTINTANYEADVFIDPSESYIIFSANYPTGYGQGDLYISYKNEDGTWTKSKNMGDLINTANHELCPFVTKDGKYFFFTSNRDIYWVDSKIIENLRL